MNNITEVYWFSEILALVFMSMLVTFVDSGDAEGSNISQNQLDVRRSNIFEINIPNGPSILAVNPNKNLVYVVSNDGTIFTINGSNDKLISEVQTNSTITDLAVNPNTDTVYVSAYSNKSILVMENIDNYGKYQMNIKKRLSATNPYTVTINPNTNVVYVATSIPGDDIIVVINGSTQEVLRNIEIEKDIQSIFVNPVTNILYVSHFSNKSIVAIDGETNKIISTIPTGASSPDKIAVDTKTNTLYVTIRDASRLLVINGRNNTLSNSFITGNISGDLANLAPNSNTNKIYMTDAASSTLSVIDASIGLVSKIHVGKHPLAVAVNPSTNKVYVANSESNTISVIDGNATLIGQSNLLFSESPGIKVGNGPNNIAVNPKTSKVYVANSESNTISVIDGSNDKLESNLQIGDGFSQIAINPNTNMIYGNTFNQGIILINGSTNRTIKTNFTDLEGLQTSINYPDLSIAISPHTNRMYVAHPKTITVIDGKSNEVLGETGEFSGLAAIAPVTTFREEDVDRILALEYRFPHFALSLIDIRVNGTAITNNIAHVIPLEKTYSAIALNPNTNMSYLTSLEDNVLAVMDLYLDKMVANITLGNHPMNIAINPNNSKVYVANRDNNTVSIIDGIHNTLIRNIPVGDKPSAVTVDPNTNLVFVANTISNTVSVIDGSANEEVVGITFSINPPSVGHIRCDQKDVETNEFNRIKFGAQCLPEPNTGYRFTGWTENLGQNSSRTAVTFSEQTHSLLDPLLSALGIKQEGNLTFAVIHNGNITANFEKIPPPIPQEYLFALYALAATIFTGWFVPSVAKWINSRLRRKRMMEYLMTIDHLLKTNDSNLQNIKVIENKITYEYAKGRISETQFNLLMKRVSHYDNNGHKNSQ